jgi:GAF domain-containing protein
MNDETLARLVEAVSSATTALEPPGLNELLQSVVDTTRELFSAAACSIATVDDEEMHLVYRIASGEGAAAIIGEQLPLGRGIAGWVASSGASIAVEDVAEDPRFAREIAERTGYIPTSILATPLESRQTVLGVLSVLDRRPPADAAEAQRDMTIIGLLARQVSLSLESAQVFDSAARLLAATLGEVSDDTDLAEALSSAAGTAGNSRQDLVALARAFARLHQSDPQLAALAADTVERFATIAAQRAPW